VKSATYRYDYDNPRSGGRVHRATDIFAPAGSKVVAARGGVVVWLPQVEQGNAGFAIQIRGDDNRTYAYYHLGPAGGRLGQAVARNVKYGSRVERGQFIGRLGDSGNAAGGAPHLHFEIHDETVTDPYGSHRRDPYPSLRAAQGKADDAEEPAPSTGTRTLRRGDRGEDVAQWQRDLNRTRPGNELPADGIFGERTERATVIFQRSVGLGPDGLGVVGPKTRAALAKIVAEQQAVRSLPTLRRGDRGDAVAQWQRSLNTTRPGNELLADGIFGERTERATVIFQRSVGLGPDGLGVVGPKTRAALARVIGAG
jgi:peptidoglycan hydrolase-like protein with peptidoglycan-binding domain